MPGCRRPKKGGPGGRQEACGSASGCPGSCLDHGSGGKPGNGGVRPACQDGVCAGLPLPASGVCAGLRAGREGLDLFPGENWRPLHWDRDGGAVDPRASPSFLKRDVSDIRGPPASEQHGKAGCPRRRLLFKHHPRGALLLPSRDVPLPWGSGLEPGCPFPIPKLGCGWEALHPAQGLPRQQGGSGPRWALGVAPAQPDPPGRARQQQVSSNREDRGRLRGVRWGGVQPGAAPRPCPVPRATESSWPRRGGPFRSRGSRQRPGSERVRAPAHKGPS